MLMDRSHPEAASLLLGTVHERHTKNDGANTFRKDEHGDTSRPYRDLRRRVAEHESGKVPSTKSRLPVRLVYYEACNILDDAIKREKQLKTGFGRAYLNRRLSDIKN
jgi:hypothetical protein